jgi:hypothetical protein
VPDREQFILVTAECSGYRKGGPASELTQAKLPDDFVVDYVRVFDEVLARPEWSLQPQTFDGSEYKTTPGKAIRPSARTRKSGNLLRTRRACTSPA